MRPRPSYKTQAELRAIYTVAPMKTVLIVDDVPEVTTLLKAQLERTGRFKVIVANDGKEALHLAISMQPDVVVSDIDMPGLDGGAFATLIGLNEATKRIPLVFLSSLVTPPDEDKPTRWPMVSKSSPIAVLLEAIDKAMKKASQ